MLIEKNTFYSHKNSFAQPSYIFTCSILIPIISLSKEQFVLSQIMCSVIMDYSSASSLNCLALDQISRLPSEIQAKKRILYFAIYCKTMSFQQGRRRGHNLDFALQRKTYSVHLGELHLVLPICHLHPFFQVPKKHWGGHFSSKQGKATGEATGFYLLPSVTG